MPLIGPTLGDHLDIGAAGAVEIGGLAEGCRLEFLDALDRCRHDARGYAVGLAAGCPGEVHYVADGVAGHVVGVVATVHCKRALVHVSAGNSAAVRVHSRLQR